VPQVRPVTKVAAISTEQIGQRKSKYVKSYFRIYFIKHGSGFVYMICGYKDYLLRSRTDTNGQHGRISVYRKKSKISNYIYRWSG